MTDHPRYDGVLMKYISLISFLFASVHFVCGQGTVPTFEHMLGQSSYTLVGHDPALGGTTTIPTVLVPIILSFDAKKTAAGKPFVMNPTADLVRILHSPVFSRFAFKSGGTTQYGDA